MKKAFLMMAAALVCLTSCDPTKTISVSVKVEAEDLTVAAPESYEVSLTSLTGDVYTAQTQNGVASFEVLPGIYDAKAKAVSEGFNIVGSAEAVFVLAGDECTVKVSQMASSDLVFSQIYLAGSGDYYFREQFYEIFNNGENDVYLDGLCIASLDAFDYEGAPYAFQIENPEKYVFSQEIWQIQGSGTDYKLAPGESVTIAQWATNHSNDNLNPNSPIGDLTGAEFEAIEGESTLWNGIVISDGPAINLKRIVVAYNTPQWLNPVGGVPMVIFYPAKELNSTDMIAADGLYGGAREIPVAWLVDAVEIVENEAFVNKALPTTVDAGRIWGCESYMGKSFVRKHQTKNGVLNYIDTNDSSNDFVVNDKPALRMNGEGVPSWNTWAN